jgi:5'-nucleotidase / UDP-sugar diphosphatase
VTHLGYEADLELAKAVPELDMIIGGHSHTQVQPPTKVGKTLVCQAKSEGLYLGQVDMFVSGGDIVKCRGFLRTIDNTIAADVEVEAIVAKYAGELENRLNEVIAQTTVALDGEREHIRAQETNLGNLVCDLIQEYAKADVCLWNGGGIRASIGKGDITVGDILTVLPFGNIVATKAVTGAELQKVLEFNAAQPRPFGGFLQVSGMTMEINGSKLGKVTVGGAPLDPKKTYILAASEFMLAGGDGYAMLKAGIEPVYLGYSESAIVTEKLREMGTVSPSVEGRIVIK